MFDNSTYLHFCLNSAELIFIQKQIETGLSIFFFFFFGLLIIFWSAYGEGLVPSFETVPCSISRYTPMYHGTYGRFQTQTVCTYICSVLFKC